MDSIKWLIISVVLLVSSVYCQIPLHGSESLQVDPILKDSLLKLPVDKLTGLIINPESTDVVKHTVNKNISLPLGIIISAASSSEENVNKTMKNHKKGNIVPRDELKLNEKFSEEVMTEIPIAEKSDIGRQNNEEEITLNNEKNTKQSYDIMVTEVNIVENINKEIKFATEERNKENEHIYTESNNEKKLNNKNNSTIGKEQQDENPDADVEEFVNSWKLGIPEDMVFTKAFVASLLVIIVSELGDKTFFIAAIMAMNNPRLLVFLGSTLALGSLHVVASFFGFVIAYIPRVYTFYASSALFIFFGLKMLWEAWRMKPEDAQEELEEVASDLKKREEQKQRRDSESLAQDANIDQENRENNNIEGCDVSYQNLAFESNEATNSDAVVTIQESETSNDIDTVKYIKGYTEDNINVEDSGVQEATLTHRTRDTETNTVTRRQVERRSNIGQDASEEDIDAQAGATKVLSMLRVMMTHPFIQAFSMTFLAEWGDRSQIATVIMGSTEDVWGIIVGGGLGHFLCTGLAVLGGQLIATKISVRTVTFIGGIVFLLFAAFGLVMGPD